MKKFKKTAVLALTAAIAFAFAGCAEKQKSPYDPVKSGDVIINEVASSNSGSYTTENGETPDWIEVKNVSGKTLDLNGCTLSDSIKNLKKFVFGECVLGPGE